MFRIHDTIKITFSDQYYYLLNWKRDLFIF